MKNTATTKAAIDQFTAREACTVLAALRYWQENVDSPKEESDHFEDVEPLTVDEIEALCERITINWNKPGDKPSERRLCTDVRCNLPANHTGGCK